MSQDRRALLVYRPGALGDALVSLPAVRIARERFGTTRMVLATAPVVVPLLTENRIADVVISADDVRLAPLLAGDVDALEFSFGPVHAAVLWGGQTLSVAASALLARGVEVIHAPSRPADDGPVHVIDHLISTVRPGIKGLGRLLSLRPSSEDLAWLESRYGRVLSAGVLAVHPGSGSPRKNWSPASYATLANMAMDRNGLRCALISGPADDGIVEQMLPNLREPPVITARDWPLGRVAALLQRAALYAGNDSGISHLAGCLGVNGIALFGPTRPEVWAPGGGTIRVLGQPTMEDHQPEDVLAALARGQER